MHTNKTYVLVKTLDSEMSCPACHSACRALKNAKADWVCLELKMDDIKVLAQAYSYRTVPMIFYANKFDIKTISTNIHVNDLLTLLQSDFHLLQGGYAALEDSLLN